MVKLKSPSRTISARGDRKYTGEFMSPKSDGPQTFDSISSLMCALFLEHRSDVARLVFEPRRSEYEGEETDEPFEAVHDYEVVTIDGEIESVEAKYSRASLNKKAKARLDHIQKTIESDGGKFSLVFRDELERDGFIETIMLLRRYGHLNYSETRVSKACEVLRTAKEITLMEWRERAELLRIQTGLLYHLLYHQRLPLKYVPLTCIEVERCRA